MLARQAYDLTMTPALPTIAHLKGHGLERFFVTCANAACQHSTALIFDALELLDEMIFIEIARRRRFMR